MPRVEYAPPLDQLLTRGAATERGAADWPDYVTEFGLGPEHIPDLIRMATDADLSARPADDPAVWAPLHAWRALGQLHAEAAILPLLPLLDSPDDDWVPTHLPDMYGLLGPAAIPALSAYLADATHDSLARLNAQRSLLAIAEQTPAALPVVRDVFRRQLASFATDPPEVTSFLVESLVEFGDAESLPLIEQAFAAGRIDPYVVDWNDVEQAFDFHSPAAETYVRRRAGLPDLLDVLELVDPPVYPPPLDHLLTRGQPEPFAHGEWPDYAAEFGLGAEHIPELIGLATDPIFDRVSSEDPAVWAPIYARRVLGQLHAEAAILPLLPFLDAGDDDWTGQDLPEVYGLIGPAAIPALIPYLADDSLEDPYARIHALEGLMAIARRDPAVEPTVRAALRAQLQAWPTNPPELNGFLIADLVKLQDADSLPAMEQAFAADQVDLIVIDWDDVQVAFGLKTEDEVTHAARQAAWARMLGRPSGPIGASAPAARASGPASAPRASTTKAKAKAKRKMAQASRKQNRKRK